MHFIIPFLHVYKFDIRLNKSWNITIKHILLLRCVCCYRCNALFWPKSTIDPGVVFKHWILISKVLIKTLVIWKLSWSWNFDHELVLYVTENKHKLKIIFFLCWMLIGVIIINYYDNPTHPSHSKQKVIFKPYLHSSLTGYTVV